MVQKTWPHDSLLTLPAWQLQANRTCSVLCDAVLSASSCAGSSLICGRVGHADDDAVDGRHRTEHFLQARERNANSARMSRRASFWRASSCAPPNPHHRHHHTRARKAGTRTGTVRAELGPTSSAAPLPNAMSSKTPPSVKRSGSKSRRLDDDDDGECNICMEAPRSVRLFPCGHASSCAECSIKMCIGALAEVEVSFCKRTALAEWVGAPDANVPLAPPSLKRLPTYDSASSANSIPIIGFVKLAASYPQNAELHRLANTLLEKWASSDHQNPLHQAVEDGDTEEITRLIVEEGADVNATEEWSGEAPIHMAMSLDTSARALPVVRCLRAHGASINAATDDERRLPIHCAAAAGLLEVVRYLVDEGADILPKDDNGATALWTACENGHLEVAQLLHSKGASITACSNNDEQPIHGMRAWPSARGALAGLRPARPSTCDGRGVCGRFGMPARRASWSSRPGFTRSAISGACLHKRGEPDVHA